MINYLLSDVYNLDHEHYYMQLPMLTATIADSYAQHFMWLEKTFIPGLRHGNRGYVFAEDKYNIHLAGCSLLKNGPDEKKLCCLFVDPAYRKQGIASKLIENTFQVLGTDKPVMTVSEQNLAQLMPLIKRYGFVLTNVRTGAYKSGVKEYYYNEGLAR